jgi:hypothetical protein
MEKPNIRKPGHRDFNTVVINCKARSRMGGGGIYRVLVGRPEGKRPLGRPRHSWKNNIKMDLREIRIDGANWIRLAQDRIRWRAFESTVMNLRVS